VARIIAIDYGSKRTGIAITDPLQLIASGLTTVETKQLMTFLKDYFKEEDVETMVIGEPKRMNNEPSAIEADIIRFRESIKKEFPELKIARLFKR